MFLQHKIQESLEEIREIARTDLALYTAKGSLVAATFQPEEELGEAAASFAESPAESQTLSGCHFFKVVVEGDLEYVLLTRSSAEDSYMVGRLAVCQVRNLAASYMERFDRNNFMQNILLGNMLVVDMYNTARKLHIEQASRIVFIIEIEGRKDPAAMELVKSLFVSRTKDFITEVDEQSIIVVKDMGALKDGEGADSLASMLVSNLQTEAMVRARVGYGSKVESLQDIARSYQEARLALEVGRVFYADRETLAYDRLGIGRLIYQLPIPLCEMFLNEVFGGEIPDIFSEDNMSTIQLFLENNLNISETARQLYIHRNTLVYRLERLEKVIGLDIRKFDDAMTFKIAMMVIAHMKAMEASPGDGRAGRGQDAPPSDGK